MIMFGGVNLRTRMMILLLLLLLSNPNPCYGFTVISSPAGQVRPRGWSAKLHSNTHQKQKLPTVAFSPSELVLSMSLSSSSEQRPKNSGTIERKLVKKKKITKKKIKKKKIIKAAVPVSIKTTKRAKKAIWDYAWLEGKPRKDVLALTQQMEIEFEANPNLPISGFFTPKDPPPKEWLDEGLQILVQWAQLGEGKKCEDLAQYIVDLHPDDFHSVKVYRRALHAHINQFKSITFNQKWRKPNFTLTRDQTKKAKLCLKRANYVLQRMESASRSYVQGLAKKSKSNKVIQSKTIVDGTDYHSLILSHCHVQNNLDALRTLRKAEAYFKESGSLERLAPSVSLYIAVSRSILSAPKKAFYDEFGTKYSPIEKVDLLFKGYVMFSQQYQSLLKPSLQYYNIVIDGWSKATPPPPKRNSKLITLRDTRDAEKKEKVFEYVTKIWRALQLDSIRPDAKTFTSLIYAYTKTDHLERAFDLFRGLMCLLLPNSDNDENAGIKGEKGALVEIDSRCFRLLVNALAKKANNVENEDRATRFAEIIEKVISMMWKLDEAGYNDTAPDMFMYTTAIKAWTNTKCSSSVDRAERLLKQLKQKAARHPQKENLDPDVAVYNAFLFAIAKQPESVDAAERAGSIVKFLEESDHLNPDVISYNTLLQACLTTKAGIPKAVQTLNWMIEQRNPNPNENTFRLVITGLIEIDNNPEAAERLLDRMEERFTPSMQTYEKLITAWCNQPGQALRAQDLLERMEELHGAEDAYNLGRESLKPKRSLYNEVISACRNHGLIDNAESIKRKRDATYSGRELSTQKLTSNDQVFALLDKIDTDITHDDRPAATTSNFNIVLGLLSNSGKIWAGQRAEDILNYMLELTIKRKYKEVRPNIITFNSAMAAWAKSGHPEAGDRAADIVSKLEELHKMNILEDVQADRITYNTLIAAYAKSEDSRSARKAQQIFDRLEELSKKTRRSELEPDIVSYSSLLNAWANSNEVDAAKTAEDIVRRMHDAHKSDSSKPKPTTVCFNEVLYAWARSQDRGSTERAEIVFELMESLDDEDIDPDRRTYNIVLLAYANSLNGNSADLALEFVKRMKESEIQPDAVTYNTLISAFTKKGGARNMGKAMEIVNEVIMSPEVTLGRKFFSTLLHTISNSNEAGKASLAEDIFAQLKRAIAEGKLDISLDTEIYNALIHCWNRSDEAGGPQRVEELLDEMLKSSNEEIAPNVRTFTSVIDTWAKSGDVDGPIRAQAILESMTVKPNAHTYTAVIRSYAKSDYKEKAKRAQAILESMKKDFAEGNRDAEPTIVAYNAVLNAAEFSVGTAADLEDAFKVACVIFDEVRSSDTLKPDYVTYGTFMGVIHQLMPKSDVQDDMIQLVFRRCCVDGMLGPVVMKKLVETASPSQYNDLMGDVEPSNLPKEWTCNVRGDNFHN